MSIQKYVFSSSKSSHTATSPGGKPKREGKDEKIAREKGDESPANHKIILKLQV